MSQHAQRTMVARTTSFKFEIHLQTTTLNLLNILKSLACMLNFEVVHAADVLIRAEAKGRQVTQ